MAEFTTSIGSSAVEIFAAGAISSACKIQNTGTNPLIVRVSASNATLSDGFVLLSGEKIDIASGAIPGGAKITGIRAGNDEPVYAVGA